MLQIKNFPDELKERLSARAQEEGTTMSALVVDFVWRELEMPSMREWIARTTEEMKDDPVIDARVVQEMREERDALEQAGHYI